MNINEQPNQYGIEQDESLVLWVVMDGFADPTPIVYTPQVIAKPCGFMADFGD